MRQKPSIQCPKTRKKMKQACLIRCVMLMGKEQLSANEMRDFNLK